MTTLMYRLSCIRWVQAIRRGAERAFRELGLRDVARIDGWVITDSDLMIRELTYKFVQKNDNKRFLDPGPEDPTPGLTPLEESRPFLEEGLTDVRALLASAIYIWPAYRYVNPSISFVVSQKKAYGITSECPMKILFNVEKITTFLVTALLLEC